MTAILKDLPARQAIDGAECFLFSEDPSDNEGNYKFDGTVPADLRIAFEKARDEKHWTLKKYNSASISEEIVLPILSNAAILIVDPSKPTITVTVVCTSGSIEVEGADKTDIPSGCQPP